MDVKYQNKSSDTDLLNNGHSRQVQPNAQPLNAANRWHVAAPMSRFHGYSSTIYWSMKSFDNYHDFFHFSCVANCKICVRQVIIFFSFFFSIQLSTWHYYLWGSGNKLICNVTSWHEVCPCPLHSEERVFKVYFSISNYSCIFNFPFKCILARSKIQIFVSKAH